MENNQIETDYNRLKKDIGQLYEDLMGKAENFTEEQKDRWGEIRENLEKKKSEIEEKQRELMGVGENATEHLKSGISASISELKETLNKIREDFSNEK